MDNDLFLIIGMIITGLALPAILGAVTGGRVPRVAALLLIIGSVLMATAAINKPSGYSFHDIPIAFSHVVNKYLN